MNPVLLGTGLACVICAVVGGGLRGFGLEFPLLQSVRRQVLLAVVGGVLILAAAWSVLVPGGSAVPKGGPAAAVTASGPAATVTESGPAQSSPPARASTAAAPQSHSASTGKAATPKPPHVAAPPLPLKDDQNYAALVSQIEGSENRLALARKDGDAAACRATTQRWINLMPNLKAVLIGHGVKSVPANLAAPPLASCDALS